MLAVLAFVPENHVSDIEFETKYNNTIYNNTKYNNIIINRNF